MTSGPGDDPHVTGYVHSAADGTQRMLDPRDVTIISQETGPDAPTRVGSATPGSNETVPSVEPGRIETSVRADLARLGKMEQGVRGTLAEMVIRMARAYDQYAGADLAKLARLNQELRQTLAAIAEVRDDDDGGEAARMSTPVWDAAESGAADVGAAGGGGGGAAGQTVDAASAGDR